MTHQIRIIPILLIFLSERKDDVKLVWGQLRVEAARLNHTKKPGEVSSWECVHTDSSTPYTTLINIDVDGVDVLGRLVGLSSIA